MPSTWGWWRLCAIFSGSTCTSQNSTMTTTGTTNSTTSARMSAAVSSASPDRNAARAGGAASAAAPATSSCFSTLWVFLTCMPGSLVCSARPGGGIGLWSHSRAAVEPGDEQRVRHGQHQRPDKDADQAERDQAADHADEDQQDRQVGAALLDEERAQHVVERGGNYRDDEQERAPARRAAPVQPDHRADQDQGRADLRHREEEHQRGEDCRERHA